MLEKHNLDVTFTAPEFCLTTSLWRYFKLRQYIVDIYTANFDRITNQNVCYKNDALE